MNFQKLAGFSAIAIISFSFFCCKIAVCLQETTNDENSDQLHKPAMSVIIRQIEESKFEVAMVNLSEQDIKFLNLRGPVDHHFFLDLKDEYGVVHSYSRTIGSGFPGLPTLIGPGSFFSFSIDLTENVFGIPQSEQDSWREMRLVFSPRSDVPDPKASDNVAFPMQTNLGVWVKREQLESQYNHYFHLDLNRQEK